MRRPEFESDRTQDQNKEVVLGARPLQSATLGALGPVSVFRGGLSAVCSLDCREQEFLYD